MGDGASMSTDASWYEEAMHLRRSFNYANVKIRELEKQLEDSKRYAQSTHDANIALCLENDALRDLLRDAHPNVSERQLSARITSALTEDK